MDIILDECKLLGILLCFFLHQEHNIVSCNQFEIRYGFSIITSSPKHIILINLSVTAVGSQEVLSGVKLLDQRKPFSIV